MPPTIGIKQGGSGFPAKVGIGTSNPSGTLHVSSDNGSSAFTGHGVTIDSGDTAGNARVELRDSLGGGRTPRR